MKIRRKIVIPITVLGISIFLITIYLSYLNFQKYIKEDFLSKNKKVLDLILNKEEKLLSSIATQLSFSSTTLRAYKENNPNLLKREFLDIWKFLRKEKIIDEIHFFKTPAINFFNFSNFSTELKDVSDVRSDIKWITSSFISSTHLLICKVFPGIRATYPIVDKHGKILGGISVGKKIDKIVYEIKKTMGKDAFIAYKEDVLHKMLPKVYADYVKDKKRINEFIIGASTIQFLDNIIQNLDFNRDIQKIYFKKKVYLLTFYRLIDFNNQLIGYVGILNNISPILILFFEQILGAIIFFIVGGFVIYSFLYKETENMLNKIKKITNISNSLRNHKFNIIDKYEISEKDLKGDELDILKYNIIKMGKELRRFYLELEDIIDKRTRELKKIYKDLEIKNKELRHRLYTDYLTQLPNRNALLLELSNSEKYVLIIMDIDAFRRINDFYGINIGNKVLIEFSKKMHEIAHKYKYKLYRLAGDEFALLKRYDNFIFLEKETIEMIKEIEEINIILDDNLEIVLNVTCGISFGDELLLEKADMALKYAKQNKRAYVFYKKEFKLEQEFKDYLIWHKILKKVIKEKNVIPYYQPIVDKHYNIVKYECLMRIKYNNKIYNPNEFLNIAMDLKFYESLSKIMFDKCFNYFKDKNLSFSINISVTDIINNEMVNFIFKKVESFPNPNNIIIEITETESIENFEQTKNFIKRIKEIGAKIAIDDFGSGYSNFEYIVKLKPDFIKIDGSLVKAIDKDNEIKLIVKGIVDIVKKLNIKSIAEFVHSQNVFDIAKEIGFDEFQGYFIGKPNSEI